MKGALSFLRVVRRDPVLGTCAVLLLLSVLAAVAGLPFTGYTYDQISDASLLPPSRAHWFGTDANGRDLLTRTLFGARISLFIGAIGAVVSFVIGVTYGMVSGYAGGRVDNLMMRLVEILYSLPNLVLVIVLVTTLDGPVAAFLRQLGLTAVSPRLVLIVAFLGFTEWMTMARLSDPHGAGDHAGRIVHEFSRRWPATAAGQLGHACFRGCGPDQSHPFLLVDADLPRGHDDPHPPRP
jgi:ABC-type dipeptide/oligopeptide/nickel transport system permease subunit